MKSNSYLLTHTIFCFLLIAQTASGNISNNFFLEEIVPTYCESGSNNNTTEHISGVVLNTIDNPSGPTFYSDFTNLSTDLIEGETYTISIAAAFPDGLQSCGYAVYIDFNNDIDFDDVGELVWSVAPNENTPNGGTFAVPFGTALTSVRMRVSMAYDFIPGPCDNMNWGEVEDYTINLSSEDPCSIFDMNDAESGWGIWNDGGADATLNSNAAFANSGTSSFLIKDNTSTSVITTDNLDLQTVAQVDIDFSFIATGFDNINQDFWIQVSTDGGSSFSTVNTWNYTLDFNNNVREFTSILIGGPFTATTQFRFRCDATGNNDKIYIDDIILETCSEGAATCEDGIQNGDETGVDCGGPECPECDPCQVVDEGNADSGWGIWNDGGADAAHINNDAYANSGSFSYLIKDNTSTSVITTDNLDFEDAVVVNVDFSFFSVGFNNTEDFWLQISTDGGASFTTVETWSRLIDFQNNVRSFSDVTIEGPFTSTTQIRFRCDASGNNDKIYIDDILITACDEVPPGSNVLISNSRVDHQTQVNHINEAASKNIVLYPNPTQTELTIEILEGIYDQVILYTLEGQIVYQNKAIKDELSIDVSVLAPGVYFARFISADGLTVTKRFVKN